MSLSRRAVFERTAEHAARVPILFLAKAMSRPNPI